MSIIQTIVEALESLASNKMRSGLTVLGIVIGVAAVIAMMAIGQGAQNSITGQIQGIGTNLLFISSGNMQQEVRNVKPLTMADAEAIADPLAAPSVLAVAPEVSSYLDVSVGKESSRINISGVTPEYSSVLNESITEGEFIGQEHILGRSAVAVIGPDTAERLFDRSSGVTGETIRIAGQPFRVIGVLKAKGGSGFGNQDDRVIVPLTTAQSRLVQRGGRDAVDVIQAQAINSDSVNAATEEISQVLRTRHRTEIGVDDFTIFSQDSILGAVQQITGVLTIFLGGIAAISLLVGGIGIMNIMLVSVTERTREIGIRLAIGALEREVLLQFLIEAVVLSSLGGMVGIALATGASIILARLMNIPYLFDLGINLLSFLFSAAIGVIFGFFPARRAAGLNPIDALRHE